MQRVEGFKKIIIYSDTDRVRCSGEDNDHPLVYYTIPQGGEVVCGYCDIVFRRREKDSWEDETMLNRFES
jgi:uncharacterized Zn-finger protein